MQVRKPYLERVTPVAFTIARPSCYFTRWWVLVEHRKGGADWDGHLSLTQNPSMGPEEIAVLTDAYEHTLRKLNLVERSDPITQLIAKKIIEIHQRGERNPQKLSELTMKELGVE
jgi:hypothetical protein